MIDDEKIREAFDRVLIKLEIQHREHKFVNKYFEGVRDALGWVLEDYADDPTEDM